MAAVASVTAFRDDPLLGEESPCALSLSLDDAGDVYVAAALVEGRRAFDLFARLRPHYSTVARAPTGLSFTLRGFGSGEDRGASATLFATSKDECRQWIDALVRAGWENTTSYLPRWRYSRLHLHQQRRVVQH